MSRFTVEFRIYGRALDPGAMTELLALKPCQVVMPGTRRGSRIVEEAMWAFNGSEDGVADSPEWSTLEEGLKSVLEKLWSRRDLIAQYNGASRKIWWCGQFHAGWNSGTALPASLLTELAEFSAEIPPRGRTARGQVAPPHGLYLICVDHWPAGEGAPSQERRGDRVRGSGAGGYTGATRAAGPEAVRQALLQCRIPAIGIAVAVTFIDAPRLILRVSGVLDADEQGENSQNA